MNLEIAHNFQKSITDILTITQLQSKATKTYLAKVDINQILQNYHEAKNQQVMQLIPFKQTVQFIYALSFCLNKKFAFLYEEVKHFSLNYLKIEENKQERRNPTPSKQNQKRTREDKGTDIIKILELKARQMNQDQIEQFIDESSKSSVEQARHIQVNDGITPVRFIKSSKQSSDLAKQQELESADRLGVPTNFEAFLNAEPENQDFHFDAYEDSNKITKILINNQEQAYDQSTEIQNLFAGVNSSLETNQTITRKKNQKQSKSFQIDDQTTLGIQKNKSTVIGPISEFKNESRQQQNKQVDISIQQFLVMQTRDIAIPQNDYYIYIPSYEQIQRQQLSAQKSDYKHSNIIIDENQFQELPDEQFGPTPDFLPNEQINQYQGPKLKIEQQQLYEEISKTKPQSILELSSNVKKSKAYCFYQSLILAQKGLINLEQFQIFGDIQLSLTKTM